MEKISIGSDTKVIADHAFEGCTAIETVTFWGEPEIGQYAFSKCSSIIKLSFGSDFKIIGDHAFDGCTSLESVTMWSDDTKIGKDAFANCPALNKVPKETGETGLSVKLDNLSKTESSTSNDSDEKSNTSDSSDGIRPEFQEAMDEYIAFFEEYCDFMKSIKESGDMLSVMDEYTSYMTQYTETMNALNELENEDMSDAEMKLYLDTVTDIQKMLMDTF